MQILIFLFLISFSIGIEGSRMCSTNQMKCKSSDSCVALTNICDGFSHCPDGEDESREFCDVYRIERCSVGQIYCPRYSCKTWKYMCENNFCLGEINSTICDAVLNHELPDFVIKKPPPVQSSLSVEDLTYFLSLINSTSSVSSKCPLFYTNVSGDCYAFLPFFMSWPESLEACSSISGHLVHPEDINKFKDLVTHMQKNGFTSDFWIGGLFDIIFDDWRWHTGDAMPLGTPYWSLRRKETCEPRQISKGLGNDKVCYHYHQTPTESVPGQCAAMEYENMFYFSNEECTELKKPICLHNTIH